MLMCTVPQTHSVNQELLLKKKDCEDIYSTDINWDQVFSEISNKNVISRSGPGVYNITIKNTSWVKKVSTSTNCMWNFIDLDIQKENPELLDGFCQSYDHYSNKEELYHNLVDEKARIRELYPPKENLTNKINIGFLITILLGVTVAVYGIVNYLRGRRLKSK